MKTISNIDLSYNPMRIPIIKGRFGIENVLNEAFPLLITPSKVGSEIVIREGHVFTLKYPYMVLNTQFRTRFKSLLKLTSDKHFTVHATVTCKGISNTKMDSILLDPTVLLPKNTEIYVTLALYESNAKHTPFKDMVELVKGYIGKSTNSFLPNIKPAMYTEVSSRGKLTDVVDFLLTKVKGVEGILLLNKNGNYTEGGVSFKESNAIVVNPTEELWGVVQRVNTSLKYLPGKTLVMADEVLIRFGETELTYNLSDEPLMLRGYLSEQQENLIGTKILCETLFLPGNSTATITKILKLNS